jgi:diguanylate cyclase (GGDEF)-like protein/PAS domain S-box-containing protein
MNLARAARAGAYGEAGYSAFTRDAAAPAGVPEALRVLAATQPEPAIGNYPFFIFENAADIILTLSNQGEIQTANRAAETLTGVARSALVGTSILDLVAPAFRDRIRLKMLGSNTRGEAEVPFRDSARACIVQVRWSPIDAVKALGYFVVARDVTEQARRETFERERRRILEMLAARCPLREILRSLCSVAEAQVPDTRFVISAPGPDGSQITVTSEAGNELDKELGVAMPLAGMPPRCSRIQGISGSGRIRLTDAGGAGDARFLDRYPYKLSVTQPCPRGRTDVLLAYRRTCAAPRPFEEFVIEETAAVVEQILQHEQFDAELRRQANFDAKTELPNSKLLIEFLTATLASAENGHTGGVLYFNLDNFKLCNDMAGFAFGDKILKRAAQRIRAVLPESAMLARMGGDEFVAVLPDACCAEDIQRAVVEVLKSLKNIDSLDLPEEPLISTSVGIAIYPADGTRADELLTNAHMALSRAKAAGKAQHRFFDAEFGKVAARRLLIHGQLTRALEKNELSLVYQPQFDLEAGAMIGVEALLRWTNPTLGSVSPVDFIPLAEQTGIILPIGTWVLEQAARQAALWSCSTSSRLKIAVNVSTVQVMQPDFVESVAAVLKDARLDPSQLELEITESAVMTDFADCSGKIAQLRRLGVSVAIDDFGTGYSSLSCLKGLPVTALKIDRAFISSITPGVRPPITHSVIALGHALGLTVTAEGVETREQLHALRELKCDAIQGYLAARPLSPEELELSGFMDKDFVFGFELT